MLETLHVPVLSQRFNLFDRFVSKRDLLMRNKTYKEELMALLFGGFHVVPSNDITDFYVVREGTVGSICLTIPQMVVC